MKSNLIECTIIKYKDSLVIMTAENVEPSSEFNMSSIQTADLSKIMDATGPQHGKMFRYQIEVKSQGSPVAEHIVEATDALMAINFIERSYGEPTEVETIVIENEHGVQRHIKVVKYWHGYTFNARSIGPADTFGC